MLTVDSFLVGLVMAVIAVNNIHKFFRSGSLCESCFKLGEMRIVP